ncbi:MAG TPA: DUF402 domain-containing protein [Acidimicrobiales bacterium]|nr:DUF402 domain-containing protein [Acidimicrobiales bacterium]
MRRDRPFSSGTQVVWRSRPGGDVGYVFGCRVLLDEPDVAAVVQPTGSPIVRRIAERGGPRGRSFLPGTWDGSRRHDTWDRPPCVRLHPVGRSYSVIRTWDVTENRFVGWYVNLEQPWARTTVGFDSRDDVLDVTVSADLDEWRLKDADELEFAVEVGLFGSTEARSIHATAELAIADIRDRTWPFDEATWTRGVPDEMLEPTELPDGWDAP